MGWRNLSKGLRSLVHGKAADRELADEIGTYLEMAAEEKMKRGMSRKDAVRAVRLEQGSLVHAREEVRSAGWESLVETFWRDVCFGARVLRKSPGFSAVAIATLALGIGANTAIFSVVNTVLLRPMPYKDAARLVTVWGDNKPKGYTLDLVSVRDFEDWKAQNHSFESMAAATDAMYTLTGAGEPAAIIAYQFSPDFFDVLGVPPALGRTFAHGEDTPGRDQVAVLSYRLWMTRFGGARSALGKSVMLDGKPYTVIGVMPASFHYPQSTELWTPLVIDAKLAKDRGARWLRVMARLKPGVTMAQVAAEMRTITSRLARAYPDTNRDEGVNLVSLRQLTTGDVRPALLVMLCCVGLVLLIACANIANLLLSRAIRRRREIAVRTALGASRMRLVRQLLTESILLSLAGGLLGIAIAYRAANLLVGMFPTTVANLSIPLIESIPVDGWLLGFALLVSILTGAIFGIAPALLACHAGPGETLKESGRSGSPGASGKRFRNIVVVAEMAMSLVLLTSAGLMTKSFLHLVNGDLGFHPDHVLTMRALLPSYKYAKDWQEAAFHDEVLRRLQALPGVRSAGSVTFLPLSGWWGTRSVSAGDRPPQRGQKVPQPVWSSVSPDYFRTMGIPLVKGRSFTGNDDNSAPGVTILSAGLAKSLFAGEDPLGKRVTINGFDKAKEVVGVVGDVHQLGLVRSGENSDPTWEVYVPFAQAPTPLLGFAILTAGNPLDIARAMQREVSAVDKEQPIAFVESMDHLAGESVALPRASMLLLAVFAAMALVLAAVGIYGVLSYSAGQRTQEIGVRIALGAAQRDVLRLVIGEGIRLTAIGVAIGVAGALAFVRVLSSELYGVKPADPAIFVAVPVLLAAVALAACYIPARRAARVDPMIALRYE